ncbi:MAG: hypothetical protein ACYTGP_04045 [Planctomycetota bacterium]|jgi:prepilin-type processing-associated H-X9-DG protein
MRHRAHRSGVTILELAMSLAAVCLLLAIILPTLAAARQTSAKERCAGHLRSWGAGWGIYLAEHDGWFPYVPVQPGWQYAGVRFSADGGRPYINSGRPLSEFLGTGPWRGDRASVVSQHCCPADRGITGEAPGFGTGRRTAFRAFGVSYRANECLLDAQHAGLEGAHRALHCEEIVTVPSRLVVMGDPIWYEVREGTGRDADWHGGGDRGNLLFLDGSVKFMQIRPKTHTGPAVFEPRLRN